ncbi:MAG: 4'-phosphopantetheinyl transferase superfamily protein [Tannerella sp.]|jgi:4'-phosphopantetheinyl transferase EntD|nr:4'-phosphopantetheinyl transferase superfamily protein [Tannerella sp.]
MPLLKKHPSPLWGIWKIEEKRKDLLHRLDKPEAYLPDLNRFQSETRKCEWLAVRVLLKELTGSEWSVSYRDNGAPYLPGSAYRISISHTKGYAAVLLSPDKSAGIDIEYCSERIHRIKSRFLNHEELKWLGENPSTNQLLVCWSAKETVFKMMEQKAADFQNDIQVIDFNPLLNTGIVSVKAKITSGSPIFQLKYEITPDYVVTHSQ